MRTLFCMLFASLLVAQEPAAIPTLDLRTDLGGDAMARILLAPRGCWEGLLLSAQAARGAKPQSRSRTRSGEATVEVWDVTFHETPRETTFRLFRDALLASIAQALKLPMPSHGKIDLAILGSYVASHGSAAGVDTAMVQSLQNRFNALPPNASPMR